MTIKGRSLPAVLAGRKNAVVRRWVERVLETYPESTLKFLSREKDPFRNPVGHALQEGLSALFDGLLQTTDLASLAPVLDGIVRIRAVQDFTARQAVSFPFLLKQILREEFAAEARRYPDDLAVLEARIDGLALLAFDLFMKCREQVYEIKANEIRRRSFVPERAGSLSKAR